MTSKKNKMTYQSVHDCYVLYVGLVICEKAIILMMISKVTIVSKFILFLDLWVFYLLHGILKIHVSIAFLMINLYREKVFCLASFYWQGGIR